MLEAALGCTLGAFFMDLSLIMLKEFISIVGQMPHMRVVWLVYFSSVKSSGSRLISNL